MVETTPLDRRTVTYGLLRLADTDVALPLSVLREVVSCPLALDPLPTSAPGVLGAMTLRSSVVPVLDLRPELGRAAPRSEGQLVVVVAHEDRLLGLLVDGVRGVASVPDHELVPLSEADGDLVLSHAFIDPTHGRTVSVLDAGAILDRPEVPVVRTVGTSTAATASPADALSSGSTNSTRTLVVVQCGAYRLALYVSDVHTTLARPVTRASLLQGDLCRGVLDYADAEVPVVDPLTLLGLGRLADDDQGAGVVLDLGTGFVVLAVSALLDLAEVEGDHVLPVPGFAMPRPDLVSGVADLAGLGPVLVLHAHQWTTERSLRALAALNTSLLDEVQAGAGLPTGEAVGKAASTSAAPYVVFSAGQAVTAPLDQVDEILPFPEDLVTVTGAAGTLGVVLHRGRAVPVVCLNTLLGHERPTRTASSCLLLVSTNATSGAGQVALAVESLGSIEPLSWTDPEQMQRAAGCVGGRLVDRSALVQVGNDPRLLPVVDLQRIAVDLFGEEPAAPPGPHAAPARLSSLA